MELERGPAFQAGPRPPTGLIRSWYTWRCNQVLREVCGAAKAVVSKANSRSIANQQKIYFLRESFSHLCKKRYQRYLLAEANDWTVAADIEEIRHYPKVLVESPDMVLVSPSTYATILVELTVPWEDFDIAMRSRRKSMQICRWTRK